MSNETLEHWQARALAAEAELQRLEAWQKEGEELCRRGGAFVLFSLGSWYADRPWRRKEIA